MATQIVINDPVSQRHLAAPVIAVVSSDANNALRTGSDGNLYVQGSGGGSGSSQPLVSQQPGNYATYGNDLGVYVGGQEILSNGRTNLLHLSDRDGRIELTKDDLADAGIGGGDVSKAEFDALKAEVNTSKSDITNVKNDVQTIKRDIQDVTIVSTDRNNVLTEGRDKGAYLDKQDIIDTVEDAGITGKVDVQQLINLGTDPLLGRQGDKLISGLSVQYNQTSGRLDILGVNGQSVANTTIPTAVQLLERVQLETNPAGQPAGTYIHFQFRLTDGTISDVYLNVNQLAQFYVAGNGINISGAGEISVKRDVIEDIVEDVIDDELGNRGKITQAIENGVEDAIETTPVKRKIAEVVEDAIKNGDVSIVSDNPNNMLKKGTDGGAFLDKADIPAAGPSTDSGNELTVGSDGKLFFKAVTDYGTL